MKVILLFCIAIFLCGCESCEDDSKPKTELEKLPPATRTGKNTFGCLVNGKAWVTRTSIDATAFYQEGVLTITAFVVGNGIDQGMSFEIRDLNLSTKKYDLGNPFEQFATFGDSRTNCSYVTEGNSGFLSITKLDNTNRIISGEFNFKVFTDECDTVRITEGRFDLTYAN